MPHRGSPFLYAAAGCGTRTAEGNVPPSSGKQLPVSPALLHACPYSAFVLPAPAGDLLYHIPTSGKIQGHPLNSLKIHLNPCPFSLCPSSLCPSSLPPNRSSCSLTNGNAPDLGPGHFSSCGNIIRAAYFPAGSAALASAAALAFSAWAFLTALYFSFSSAVATGRMASRGQTLVQSLQPTHLS